MFTSHTAPKRAIRIVALGLAFLLLNATLVAPASAVPPGPAAVGDTIVWDASARILTNVSRANFPRAAVDSNNKTHIVYLSQSGTQWEVRYINNVGGAFNVPGQLIDTLETNPSVPSAIILAGPGNTLHLIYIQILGDAHDKLYYLQSTNNGSTWSSRQQISAVGNAKASEPNMTIDPSGNVHFVWLSNECGEPVVQYRVRTTGGALSAISRPKDTCTFQNRPQITIAGGKPHVVLSQGNPAELYYARLEGSQWLNQNITNTGTASLNPSLASDGGNNLFVAWDENAGNHEIWFKASFDGGLTWSAPTPYTNNPGISTYPYVNWSPVTQRAYIVWHDQNTVLGGPDDIWEREFNPVTKVTSDAFQVSNDSGLSKNPMIALGPSHADIVWHDNTTSNYQIYDLGGRLRGGDCTGTLTLTGKPAIKGNQINGTITRSDQACTKMQISLDTPVTDATPSVDFSETLPTQTVPSGSACSHTVYVRLLKDGTTPGNPFNDSIKVDNSVDAYVAAVNPNMATLPTIYNQHIVPADAYQGGARDGDPGFTRVRKFFLGVFDASDCAGLKQLYAMATGEPVTDITNGVYAGSPALPGSASPGARSITVLVTDTLGTGQAFSSSLIYDPADTDPSEDVTNTLGLPVLNMAQTPSVAAPQSTDNISITLSFNNIQVSDNLYGDGPGPSTNDFWGVWVANSPIDIAADSPLLNWVAVKVPSPGPAFSIEWNVFSGLDERADRRAGNYFIYVRFLDGAGNPSASVLKTQTNLSNSFSAPTIYAPFVRR